MPTRIYRVRHCVLWEWGQCLGLEHASLFSNLSVTVSSDSAPSFIALPIACGIIMNQWAWFWPGAAGEFLTGDCVGVFSGNRAVCVESQQVYVLQINFYWLLNLTLVSTGALWAVFYSSLSLGSDLCRGLYSIVSGLWSVPWTVLHCLEMAPCAATSFWSWI